MKNEPIIAYNHLQDEEEESAHGGQMESHEKIRHGGWRFLMHPFALVLEIAAIVTLLILMIEEILH